MQVSSNRLQHNTNGVQGIRDSVSLGTYSIFLQLMHPRPQPEFLSISTTDYKKNKMRGNIEELIKIHYHFWKNVLKCGGIQYILQIQLSRHYWFSLGWNQVTWFDQQHCLILLLLQLPELIRLEAEGMVPQGSQLSNFNHIFLPSVGRH